MKFLLDANMPRSSAELLRKHGHEAEDVRNILPGGADDEQLALTTRDLRLLRYPQLSPSRLFRAGRFRVA